MASGIAAGRTNATARPKPGAVGLRAAEHATASATDERRPTAQDEVDTPPPVWVSSRWFAAAVDEPRAGSPECPTPLPALNAVKSQPAQMECRRREWPRLASTLSVGVRRSSR